MTNEGAIKAWETRKKNSELIAQGKIPMGKEEKDNLERGIKYLNKALEYIPFSCANETIQEEITALQEKINAGISLLACDYCGWPGTHKIVDPDGTVILYCDEHWTAKHHCSECGIEGLEREMWPENTEETVWVCESCMDKRSD